MCKEIASSADISFTNAIGNNVVPHSGMENEQNYYRSTQHPRNFNMSFQVILSFSFRARSSTREFHTISLDFFSFFFLCVSDKRNDKKQAPSVMMLICYHTLSSLYLSIYLLQTKPNQISLQKTILSCHLHKLVFHFLYYCIRFNWFIRLLVEAECISPSPSPRAFPFSTLVNRLNNVVEVLFIFYEDSDACIYSDSLYQKVFTFLTFSFFSFLPSTLRN